MQYTVFTLLALATAVLATPTPASTVEERQNGVGLNPTRIFTNASCTIDHAATTNSPLNTFFPQATAIGHILGPKLKKALGPKVLDDIDVIAEDLCISADEGGDGPGICNTALQAVHDLANHRAKAAADKYRCLLNLLCVAQSSPNNLSPCRSLEAGVDCVANRIIDEKMPECPAKSGAPYGMRRRK